MMSQYNLSCCKDTNAIFKPISLALMNFSPLTSLPRKVWHVHKLHVNLCHPSINDL
ncbi:hypothetical protein CAL7102_07910 [Dulcicalothrix desertica PCC 7102]|nr:hypothetical protein CAL7102_07910 [Dulcicalothrix desertica PCC 7102]